MDIPVNDLSEANELGRRVLAAETIFKSKGSTRLVKINFQNYTPFQSHYDCSFWSYAVVLLSSLLVKGPFRFITKMNGAPSTIQFEVPPNIREIYVLSLSMYLRTSSGGFLLGGTEPKKFPITFDCNNVDEDSASSNVKLGELDYEKSAYEVKR